jgi:SAM-dependent methyltransferase
VRTVFTLGQKAYQKLLDQFPQCQAAILSSSQAAGDAYVIDLKQLFKTSGAYSDPRFKDQIYSLAYHFDRGNFLSYYYQLQEILALPKSQVQKVLEIGPGDGIFGALLGEFDFELTTVDLLTRNRPDVAGDMRQLPFAGKAFDAVCAFEALQHLPYENFAQVIGEMRRCSRHYVYLSLPCWTNSFYWHLRLHFRQRLLRLLSFEANWFLPLPFKSQDKNVQKLLQREDKHNPHYWEVNRKSFPKRRIHEDIEACGLKIIKKFHNPFHPYHYFLMCQVTHS